MSSEQYQRTVNSLDKEIADLEKKRQQRTKKSLLSKAKLTP